MVLQVQMYERIFTLSVWFSTNSLPDLSRVKAKRYTRFFVMTDAAVRDSAGLIAALESIPPNTADTITLANTIDHVGNITVGDGRDVTFDLTSGNLNIEGFMRHGSALTVHQDSSVSITGGGELNLSSRFDPLLVFDSSKVTVTNVTGNIVRVHDSELTVLGDVTGSITVSTFGTAIINT